MSAVCLVVDKMQSDAVLYFQCRICLSCLFFFFPVHLPSLTNFKLRVFFFWNLKVFTWAGLPRLCFQMHWNHREIFLWSV